VRPGETPAGALTRKVPAETGIRVRPVLLFGRRIHPRTGRTVVYLAAEALNPDDDLQVLDVDDLDEVEWASLEQVRERMPDIYEPVLEHLRAVLGGSSETIAR
jgi:8-oxo-dGTP diphosphatase